MNIFLKETNYELLSIGNCHKEQFLVNNTNIKKTFYYFRCSNVGPTEKAKKKFFLITCLEKQSGTCLNNPWRIFSEATWY